MAVFEGEESSTDIINNDAMSDDGAVTSSLPLRHLFVCLLDDFFPRITANFFFIILQTFHFRLSDVILLSSFPQT